MDAVIEHDGVVLRTEGDTVFVRITAQSACGSCKARAACGLSEVADKIIEVREVRDAQFVPGEKVMVGVKRSAGTLAVLLAFVGSLAVLIGVLLVAVLVLGWSQGTAALASLVGVVLYYCVLWLFRHKIEHTIHFSINRI